jgi:uncharacterized membrane protein
MNRSRATRYLICFVLLFAALGGLLGSSVALAAEEGDNDSVSSLPGEEDPPPEQPITFTSKFPTVEDIATSIFEFEVFIKPSSDEYLGKYEFTLTTPPGWEAGVWGSYPEKRVSAIDFTGEQVHSETIEVKAFAEPGKRPEPGEYRITLEMNWEAGDIKSSIDLTAVVIASYDFAMFTESGRLNAQTKAGEDNHIPILLVNTGTAAIEDIALSATTPEGWSITFDPEKIDSLEPDLEREIDVVIRPPKKTVAGDYLITLKADSERGIESLELRVTVLTSTLWGWAGIGITAGVIASLVILFRRLGRR